MPMLYGGPSVQGVLVPTVKGQEGRQVQVGCAHANRPSAVFEPGLASWPSEAMVRVESVDVGDMW
jgi:hypothetical protein